MNKIDDFFKNRLEVNSSEDDGWNIPSDDLWNAAKPHFPKEKRKKSFFWLWLAVGLIVISGASIWYGTDSNIQSQDSIADGKSATDPGYHRESVLPAEVAVVDEISNKEEDIIFDKTLIIDEIETTIKNEELLLSQNIAKKTLVVIDNYDRKSINDNALREDDVVESNNEISQVIPVQSNVLDEYSVRNTSNSFSVNEEFNIKVSAISTVESTSIEKNEFSELNDRPLENSIPLLESKRNITVVAAPAELLANKDFPFIYPKVVVWPKKEVGLSSQLFFVSLLNGKNVAEAPEKVVFNGRYRNLNFKYTKWIGRKWSISTGLLFADLAVNLDFDTKLEYDEDDFEEVVETQYGELINKKYDPNSNKLISLKPGVELINGDEVKAIGQVDLGLRVLQVPIILNYHWYTRKVEFYTGVGVGLEAIWGREQNINLSLYKDEILISDPVNQDDTNQNYFDYSIYTKLGTKFNINRNFNLDVNLSILVLEPIFSGVEVGFHYRWHE